MKITKSRFSRLVARMLVLLMVISGMSPYIALAGSESDFVDFAAGSGAGRSTQSAIGTKPGGSDVYEQGEYVEGDYISGTYEGRNTLSSLKSNAVSGAAIKLDKFEIKIDGKVVYSGEGKIPDNKQNIEVTSVQQFGFNLEWSVGNETSSGDALMGKTVTIQIGKFKGLTFEGLNKVGSEPLRIGKIEVAQHSLSYPEKPDDEGYRTLSYVIVFNNAIGDFENVKGYFGGTSSFSSDEYNKPLDYIFGTNGKGTITVTQEWVYPQGQGWGAPGKPYNQTAVTFEKNGTTKTNEWTFDWTAKFHDLAIKHQSDTKSIKNLENVILMDTLDKHQTFVVKDGETPFAFEVPYVYAYKADGTTMSAIKLDDDVLNGVNSWKILNAKMTGIKFKEVAFDGKKTVEDIKELINNSKVGSWIIVKEENASDFDKLAGECLIINLGALGEGGIASDTTRANINSRVSQEITDSIQQISNIDNWQQSLSDGANKSWQSLYNLYSSAIESNIASIEERIGVLEEKKKTEEELTKAEAEELELLYGDLNIGAVLEAFNGELSNFITISSEIKPAGNIIMPKVVKTSDNKYKLTWDNPGENDLKYPEELAYYAQRYAAAGKEPVIYTEEFWNFAEHAKNFKKNYDDYSKNAESYKTAWYKHIAMCENAKAFYAEEAVNDKDNLYAYGFEITYTTELVDESIGVRDVTNSMAINGTGYEKGANKKSENNYDGGIQGNYRLGDVVIRKIDSESKKLLRDVEFELYRSKTDQVPLKFTNKNSSGETSSVYYYDDGTAEDATSRLAPKENEQEIVIWGLPGQNTYYLKEVKTPGGYYSDYDSPEKFIEIKPDYKKVVIKEIENVQRKATIVKVDGESTGSKLQNAEFNVVPVVNGINGDPIRFTGPTNGVYLKAEGNKGNATLKTNGNGITVAGLDAGEYAFVETKAPGGYYFKEDEKTYPFTLEKNLPDSNVVVSAGTAKNYRIPGSVTLTKTDSDTKETIADVPFVLYKKTTNGDFVPVTDFNLTPTDSYYNFSVDAGTIDKSTTPVVIRTDSSGKIAISGLPWGNYRFKEYGSVDYYHPNTNTYNFTIDAGKANDSEGIANANPPKNGASVLPTNNPYRGSVFLYKYDESYEAKVDGKPVDASLEYEVKEAKDENFPTITVEKPLSGAKFKLYKELDGGRAELVTSDNKDGIYVTDNSGVLVASSLKAGKYYFVECYAPTGYEIDADKHISFTIPLEGEDGLQKHNVLKILFAPNVSTKYDITLTKTSENGGVLQGADYRIYGCGLEDADGKCDNGAAVELKYDSVTVTSGIKNSVGTYSTGVDGKLKFTVDLSKAGDITKFKHYHLREVKAPQGYSINTQDVIFKMPYDNIKVTENPVVDNLTQTDKLITYRVELVKYDSEFGGDLMEGVKFKLYDADKHEISGVWTTDEKGSISISGLAAGTYYLTEERPTGYKPLTSADTYRIKGINDAGYVDRNYMVDNAAAYIEFKIDEKSGGNESTESEYAVQIQVVNERQTGSAELIKYGNTSLSGSELGPLEGVKYELYSSDDKLIDGTYVTDSEGRASFNDLPWGEYYVIETESVDDYVIDEGRLSFKIDADSTEKGEPVVIKGAGNQEIVNQRYKSDVVLYKYQKDGNPLSGATFKLYKKDNNSDYTPYGAGSEYELPTVGEGIIEVKNLPLGDYCFVETGTVDGYYIPPEYSDLENLSESLKFSVTKGEDGQNREPIVLGGDPDHRIVNELYDIVVMKISAEADEEEKPLSGAVFELYDSNKERIGNDTYVTDNDGRVTLKAAGPLEAGTYYLKEVTAPEGYSVIKDYIQFVVHENEPEPEIIIPVSNFRTPVDAVLYKTGVKEYGQEPVSLEGAEFELYQKVGDEWNKLGETVVSDRNGKVRFRNLSWGEYYAVESKAPEGYVLNDVKHYFDINSKTTDGGKISEIKILGVDDEGNNVSFENVKAFAGVELIKTDAESSEPLKGAKFELYRGTELIGTYDTDEDGKIRVEHLETGAYSFVEVLAPDGYIFDENNNVYSFDISIDNKDEMLHVEADNKRYDIQVLKTDGSDAGRVLSGAEFELYDSEKKRIDDRIYVTGDDGRVSLGAAGPLKAGIYYLREVKAPVGYLIAEQDIQFEVRENETEPVIVISVSNSRLPVDAVLYKTGVKEYGQEPVALKGAAFELYRELSDGRWEKLGQTVVSYVNGEVWFRNLSWGEYYAVETVAPDGYVIDKDRHYFTVNAETIEIDRSGKIGKIKILGVDNEGNDVRFENVKAFAAAELIKTDEEGGQALAGAVFELYRGTELVGTYYTDDDGKIKVENLETGAYRFVEVHAPNGYIFDENNNVYSFDVSVENNEQTLTVEVKNRRYDVQVLKTDRNNADRVLEGAEFELYKKTDGEYALYNSGYVTGADGTVSLGNLMPGDYRLVEVKAPSGYRLNGEGTEFTIEADWKEPLTVISVTNVKRSGGGPDPVVPDKPDPENPVVPEEPVTPPEEPVTPPEEPVTPPEEPVTPPEEPVTPPDEPVTPVEPDEPNEPVIPPVIILPDGGIQGEIGPDDPFFYIDDMGVPRSKFDDSIPDYWIDDMGIPLGNLTIDGWVTPDVPVTGVETGFWTAMATVFGALLLAMTLFAFKRRRYE